MVIWPVTISSKDKEWLRACALFQVLALDPRQLSPKGSKPRQYFESADDFLIRPNIWADKKLVQAPYFSYSLRFNVSVSVHGSISLDSTEEIKEFKRGVNAALQSSLTVSERKRWEAHREFVKCSATNDVLAKAFDSVATDESRKAHRYYREVQESISDSRRHTGYAAASLCPHEDVLDGLVRLGSTLLQASLSRTFTSGGSCPP